MFIFDRGCCYSIDVCLVLSVSEVFVLGKVGLEADKVPIVDWGDKYGSLPTHSLSGHFNLPSLTLPSYALQ